MSALVDRLRRAIPAGDTAWALATEFVMLVSVTLSFWLLVDRLGAEAYGGYVGLFALIGPAIAFAHSGVTLTIFEHIAGEREDSRHVAAACLTMVLLLGSGLTLLITGLASALVPNISVVTALLFVASELLVGSIIMTSIALIQATEGYAPAARLRIMATVARASVLVALAIAGDLSLRNLSIAQFSIALVVLLAVRRRVEGSLGIERRFGPLQAAYFKTTALYSVGVTSSGIQADSDKVVMTNAGLLGDAGRYGAAYRIINLAQLPINAIIASTHLSFLERDAATQNQVERAKRYSLVVLIYTLPVVGIILVAAPLIPRVLGSDFDGTVKMVRLLTPVVLLRGLSPFPSNGLMGLGLNRLRTAILIGCAALSLALYIPLIPEYSWRGAIVATWITESFMTIVMWGTLLWAQRRADATGAAPLREPVVVGS